MKPIQTRWTDPEYQVLRDNPDLDDRVLADKLNRTVRAVHNTRAHLGVLRDRSWKPEEIALVRDNPDLTLHELAKVVGRPVSSCHRYRQILAQQGVGPVGLPVPFTTNHEPDPAFRSTLKRLALAMADGDEDIAAVLLKEITDPSVKRPSVGELCGRDAP